MKTHLLTVCLLAMYYMAAAQTTYTFNAPSGSWSTATNWLPQRNSPAANDILVFNSNVTITDLPASEAIGKLSITNNATINISSSIAGIIQVGHADVTAPHFLIGSGCSLNITGSNAVQIDIGVGYTGEVNGNISVAGGEHLLTSVSANSLYFKNGSFFTADAGFSGYPFGAANENSVIFETGATFISRDGSNPFAMAAPASVVIFQSGSLYDHQKVTAMSISGRTFGHLSFNVGANHTYSVTLGNDWIIQNNLIINNHNYTFNPASGSGSLKIYGDIVINGAGNLVLGSTASNSTQMVGSSQSIGSGAGSGTISIKNLINNNVSTTLHRLLTVTGILDLQNGFIKTSPLAILSLSPEAGIQSCAHPYNNLPYLNMGCNNSYIEGPIEKQGLANQFFSFPVGINGIVRPIILHNASGDFTAQYFRGNPQMDVGSTLDPAIHHISGLEYWNLSGSGTAAVELSFMDPNSGGVTDMNALKVAHYNGSMWVDAGSASYLGSAGANGSVTTEALSSFGNFSLAGATGYPNNPLPDKPYSWSAVWQNEQVQLNWQVLNDALYKEYLVERSVNGAPFQAVSGRISPKNRGDYSYKWYDQPSEPGKIGYRLRMVTLRGSTEYTSIEYVDNKITGQLIVSPNPASEKIFIKIPFSRSISELEIVNISGLLVKRVYSAGQASISLDISTLSSGVYYIRYTLHQNTTVSKFFKF